MDHIKESLAENRALCCTAARKSPTKNKPPSHRTLNLIKKLFIVLPQHSSAGRATRTTQDDARPHGRGILSVNLSYNELTGDPSQESKIQEMTKRKYTPKNLLPALRTFVEARNACLKHDFTDNGGAIHSIERIVDILGLALKYPHLSHRNKLKEDKSAEISREAREALKKGDKVQIEHVVPQRAFAREVCKKIDQGETDEQIISYIKNEYRLVLLSVNERARLDKSNRSKISKSRLEENGIEIYDNSK